MSQDAVKRPRRWIVWSAVAALGFVALVHVWVFTAGKMWHWPERSRYYYHMLAEAFLAGKTHLLVEPAPELLALPNPYDGAANRSWRLHDALLYEGQYYFYWGPAPAVITMGLKLLGAPRVGDNLLVLSFTFGAAAITALLLVHLHRRWFAELAGWPVVAGMLVAGLGTPIPFMLARPSVYEAAIMGGQFFLLASAYLALTALRRDTPPSSWRVLLAGTCAGAAFASRLSLLPAVGALAALFVWHLLWQQRPRWRTLVKPCAALAAPMVITAGLLAWYNHARFGSVGESGLRYMLASNTGRQGLEQGPFSAKYVLPNTVNYLLAPVSITAKFPYVTPKRGSGFVRRNLAPAHYRQETVAGMLTTSPLLLLTLAALPWRRGRDIPAVRYWLALLLGLIAAAALALPALAFFYCTIRYLADLTCGLTVLATIGLWRLVRHWPHARLAVMSLAAALTVYTCFVGVMLAVTGYFNHFRSNNPALYWRLRGETPPATLLLPNMEAASEGSGGV